MLHHGGFMHHTTAAHGIIIAGIRLTITAIITHITIGVVVITHITMWITKKVTAAHEDQIQLTAVAV